VCFHSLRMSVDNPPRLEDLSSIELWLVWLSAVHIACQSLTLVLARTLSLIAPDCVGWLLLFMFIIIGAYIRHVREGAS
jgi:hypothetical protein